MTVPRSKFGGALLPDGRVLIAGGQAGGPFGTRVASTQIYDPRTGRFLSGPELNENRFKLSKAVVSLKDGRVLIAGGAEQPEVYDPSSGAFAPVGGAKFGWILFLHGYSVGRRTGPARRRLRKTRRGGSQPCVALPAMSPKRLPALVNRFVWSR